MAQPALVQVAGTKAADRVADVVFVHGLTGDARLTWQIDDWEESFWPKLLYNDVPQLGIWSLDYDAQATNWFGRAMPIIDRATNLGAVLKSEGVGERPLFFVCHSLGGLIVKQLLRSEYDQSHESDIVINTKAIFYFATPHLGSTLSTYARWLGAIVRPSVLTNDLEFADHHLRDLNAWYRGNSERLGIATIVFAETKPTAGAMVVDQVCSDPGIAGVVPIPVDANHVEICKLDTDTMQYKTVVRSLQNFVRDLAVPIPVKDSGTLWLDVSCFNKYPEQWEEKNSSKPVNQILKYRAERLDGELRVRADLPYLTAVREGNPVWAVQYMWMPFRWLPLFLDLKLLNRSEETIYITQIELQVESSISKNEPLLIVKRHVSFPSLYIKNDGWGPAMNATLRLAFTDSSDEPAFPEEFPFTVALDRIDEELLVDLSEQFNDLGVDVQGVMNHDPVASLGPFQSGIAYVFGELEYTAIDASTQLFRFGTDIRIEPPVYGMYGPPTFEYQAQLRPDGANYVIPIEVSQVIPPGESDRVLLQLDVEKSSNHRLRLCFHGSMRDTNSSMLIDLELFVPRSVADRLRPAEALPPSFK